MADITLRRNVFGDGYSGSLKVPAGLSWMDSMAIQSAARSARETSAETSRAREALDRIGYDVADMADSINRLESTIGLKLDEQTHVLEQQSQALEEIRGAVVNPAKTRAAERVANAAQLLSHDRFERALKVANEAIDADPNNPNGFFATGWALVGLERFDEAREMFEEARDASHGDQRSLGSRQSARSAFLAGKPDLAYALVRDARQIAESGDEQAAVAYDIAVYAVAAGDAQTAIESIQKASRHDSRHAGAHWLIPHSNRLRTYVLRLRRYLPSWLITSRSIARRSRTRSETCTRLCPIHRRTSDPIRTSVPGSGRPRTGAKYARR